MAEQELRATDAEAQKDWQKDASDEAKGENVTSAQGDAVTDSKDDGAKDDEYGVSMDKVEAILNATADKKTLNPQMQRMMQRQAENTKRVEESIKGTKANPGWFVPLFCALMIIGLIWAVTYYLTTDYPIPGIGAWNLAIAFAILMVGFLMTMWWR